VRFDIMDALAADRRARWRKATAADGLDFVKLWDTKNPPMPIASNGGFPPSRGSFTAAGRVYTDGFPSNTASTRIFLLPVQIRKPELPIQVTLFGCGPERAVVGVLAATALAPHAAMVTNAITAKPRTTAAILAILVVVIGAFSGASLRGPFRSRRSLVLTFPAPPGKAEALPGERPVIVN
jgi:hypothetical protein